MNVKSMAETLLQLASAVPLPQDDELVPSLSMEIMAGDEYVAAAPEVWRAWTGQRRLWGQEYHGPVYPLGKDDMPWTGARVCGCKTCQEHVLPALRPN